MKQIEEYEKERGKNKDRWVEIPCDFEDISIHHFDQTTICSTEYEDFELGVEIYDEKNQKWPFRVDKFMPTKHSHEILADGEYQIIASHSNKALAVRRGSEKAGAYFVQRKP